MPDHPRPTATSPQRPALDDKLRSQFDDLLAQVLAALPADIRALIDRLPLCVEDWPSAELLSDLGDLAPDELFGLYDGIPLTERGHEDAGSVSELIYLFRGSLMTAARRADGRPDLAWLRDQIRITVLHELGHHYGLDEDWLQARGYG